MIIKIVSDWWNHDDVSILLKIVEKFILNSDDAPDCSSYGLGHHADEGKDTELLNELCLFCVLNGKQTDDPPEAENCVNNHAAVVESRTENHFIPKKFSSW